MEVAPKKKKRMKNFLTFSGVNDLTLAAESLYGYLMGNVAVF
jgi:hypothetical protein